MIILPYKMEEQAGKISPQVFIKPSHYAEVKIDDSAVITCKDISRMKVCVEIAEFKDLLEKRPDTVFCNLLYVQPLGLYLLGFVKGRKRLRLYKQFFRRL